MIGARVSLSHLHRLIIIVNYIYCLLVFRAGEAAVCTSVCCTDGDTNGGKVRCKEAGFVSRSAGDETVM